MNSKDRNSPAIDSLDAARTWLLSGQQTAIARVIKTWGSSPRPVGSIMTVNNQSGFAGSVSGGCIEGAVIKEAQAVIQTGVGKVLTFGVSNEQAWDVGLACGGEISVSVQLLETEQVAFLLAARESRETAVWTTTLPDGDQFLFKGEDIPRECTDPPELLAAVKKAVASGQSQLTTGDQPMFVHVFSPAPRLVVVGAVHIAQCLAPMAALAGYEVTIVDPRRGFASRDRFPDTRIVTEWPDDAIRRIAPDADTAVVVLTHDPKLDDAALQLAVTSEAFYIGALGSKKTHRQRLSRLAAQGIAPRDLDKIHGPVGLDLGGRLPAEIAVAILAEMTLWRRGGGLKEHVLR